MIRAARLAAALLFACLGLVATAAAPATAADCTCKQGTLERQVARADAVFIGTVDNVEVADDDHTYDVTATRTYKGTPERSTQVFSAGGKNACGLGELRAGTNYVFLATGTAAPFEADSCSGTTVRNDTKVTKIEKILGEDGAEPALVEPLEFLGGDGIADSLRGFGADVGGDQRLLDIVEGRGVESGAAGEAGQIVGKLVRGLGKAAAQAVEPAHWKTPCKVSPSRPVIRISPTSPRFAPATATGANESL